MRPLVTITIVVLLLALAWVVTAKRMEEQSYYTVAPIEYLRKQITRDMTPEQVVKLMGEPNDIMENNGLTTTNNYKTYKWRRKDGIQTTVKFRNDVPQFYLTENNLVPLNLIIEKGSE